MEEEGGRKYDADWGIWYPERAGASLPAHQPTHSSHLIFHIIAFPSVNVSQSWTEIWDKEQQRGGFCHSLTHSLTSWIKLWRLLIWERESSSPSAPALIAAHLADELIRLQTRGLIQSTVHAQLLLIRLLVYKQLILFFKKLIFWFICPQRAAPDVTWHEHSFCRIFPDAPPFFTVCVCNSEVTTADCSQEDKLLLGN